MSPEQAILVKYLYFVLGLLFLGVGMVGVVLPVLPTTPFLLLAVWAFARSSPRLERWLVNHPRFGPLIRNWRDHRVIPLYAKVLAWTMMAISFVYLLLLSNVATVFALCAGGVMLACALFIALQPSKPAVGERPAAPQPAFSDTNPDAVDSPSEPRHHGGPSGVGHSRHRGANAWNEPE